MGSDHLKLLPSTSEEDSDIDEDQDLFQSDRACDLCEEPLAYTDEVFLLEASQSAFECGKLFWEPLLDNEGDYHFQPLIVHFACWEPIAEEIRDACRDTPPWEKKSTACKCTFCGGDILPFAPFIALTYGEIRASRRRPSGEISEHIERLGQMNPACLDCVTCSNEDLFTIWEELFLMWGENGPTPQEEEELTTTTEEQP